jgi:hypothetical protein
MPVVDTHEQGMCSNEEATVLPVYEIILRDFLVSRMPKTFTSDATVPSMIELLGLPAETTTKP